ncbi:MAG: hypothetical protein K0R17_2944 [Rariglobus sp.]|jgi:hypothetical protein|nr:hypothetical protein [Rariglobus sp.]
MNRFYLIVPIVLLGLFGGIYWQHSRTAATEAAGRAAETDRIKAAELAKKTEAERVAREDAARRAAEREAEELKKEEEKRARWAAEGKRIEEETARFAARIAELAAQTTQTESELATLRADRERLDRENFELAREVELARIAKRTAELEIQRAVDVVAQRAALSATAPN